MCSRMQYLMYVLESLTLLLTLSASLKKNDTIIVHLLSIIYCVEEFLT